VGGAEGGLGSLRTRGLGRRNGLAVLLDDAEIVPAFGDALSAGEADSLLGRARR